MKFNQLGLSQPVLAAIEAAGYTSPTPIQSKAIPPVLNKRDVFACAQTGTGKTAAFAIPMLELLQLEPKNDNNIKALVLTPTRELALQIEENCLTYGKNLTLKIKSIFGGVSQVPQVAALQKGIDILIATPGRLLDLMQQGYVHLSDLRILVLDEADRMLDMGFVNDVKKIVAKLPVKRQTLLFSATIPEDIRKLANAFLRNPEEISVNPVSSTADTVKQSVYFVDKKEKAGLLAQLLHANTRSRSLVFTRTRHGADRLVKQLGRAGIQAAAIHGSKSQSARQKALEDFKNSRIFVLVATDIAARGIDIDELPRVVNYELPEVPETYVHRIGRTGRAGLSGEAISLCDTEEMKSLKGIQKLIGKQLPEGKITLTEV
ncbi:DEAD/DEAH box helicase [Rurimicrobium arvi]|uniref:DEAD/DEAH box helicase n=1 Tax=Rurimicrobium arvi TaxID=2049916 RepID=A0ABP8MHI7_9BACT